MKFYFGIQSFEIAPWQSGSARFKLKLIKTKVVSGLFSIPSIVQSITRNFKPLAIVSGYTAECVSDLVGNLEKKGFLAMRLVL